MKIKEKKELVKKFYFLNKYIEFWSELSLYVCVCCMCVCVLYMCVYVLDEKEKKNDDCHDGGGGAAAWLCERVCICLCHKTTAIVIHGLEKGSVWQQKQ